MGTFRPEYRELVFTEKLAVGAIKDSAEAMEEVISTFRDDLSPQYDRRCLSIAMTKLEEAVMWAVKGITA